MNLKFYIIYTSESFSKLTLAINSLLNFSNYHYILVGNGLSSSEAQEIELFVKKSSRLSFLDLPGNVTVPHGTALTHLFNTSNDQFFCFMDSDVFAFKDFSKELESKIAENDVISSCKPIEWLHKTSISGYRGHCTVSPSGLNIAMTYFAIYKRLSVNPILNKYKISFERYMRASQVPKDIHNLLSKKDQHTWKFNTAKLLNILQAYNGSKLYYQEFDGLIHLGGVSRYSEHTIQGTRKSINSNNTQAVDRVKSRCYFHELLTNIEQEKFVFPKLDLKDTLFETSIRNVSQKLILLYQSLKKGIK